MIGNQPDPRNRFCWIKFVFSHKVLLIETCEGQV